MYPRRPISIAAQNVDILTNIDNNLKMIVVDTSDIFESLLSKLQVDDVVLDVVLADSKRHPCNNDVSVILLQFLDDDSVWCLPIYHNETIVAGDVLVEWYKSFVE